MEILPYQNDVLDCEAEVIIAGIATDLKLGGNLDKLDKTSGGMIRRLIDCQEITGKALDTTVLLAPSGVAASHLVVVGLGDVETLNTGTVFRCSAAAARAVTQKQRGKVLFAYDGRWSDDWREAAVAGAVSGCEGQDLYREQKKRFSPAEVLWSGFSDQSCERGKLLGQSVNLTRRLVNQPAQDMYPESFAGEATRVAQETGITVEVWDEHELQRQRCGALLAVARGSAKPPRMVIARYQRAPGEAPLLALVGKGVTFDSGGLSLKPSDGMKTMKCDMAGAATVLGAIHAIAQLNLPVNVVGLMGLVENMVGPDSYKLGDVLTARNGRTIEVLNTDAEGRLVLADALSVAVDFGAARIIDLATLTGACMVALGTDVSGLMTNDQPWCDRVQAAANRCGEPAWQLPMFAEYGELIRSEVADIKNIGEGRWAGAITAAKLLEEFVNDVPWVHIDIAGPSFLDKPKPWSDAGASGHMVRTLVEVARDLANESGEG